MSRTASGAPKKPPNGLDDGLPKTKKRKRATAASSSDPTSTSNSASGGGGPSRQPAPTVPKEELKIRPKESMREFRQRVDLALPVTFPRGGNSTSKASGASSDDRKRARQQRKQANRVRDAQAGDDAADAELSDAVTSEDEVDRARRAGKRARGRSPDPWADLARQQGAVPRFGETAQAPPKLSKPRQVFRVHKGTGAGVEVGDVPKTAGSLAKREELAGERRGVVAAYRKLVEKKRNERRGEVE